MIGTDSMLGKRTPQADFFDSDQQYLHFVGGDTFYGYLAQHRHELFRDEDFARLYCLDNGRTSVPPSILACALILQWYDNVSDEEATERAKYDVRWKVALGVDLLNAPFAKSVLCDFRNKLIVHKQQRKMLEMSLTHARARGFFKSHRITLAVDTTPIFGKGAVEDTYNMLAEGLRQVLRVLARLEDISIEELACQHELGRYVGPSFKGSFTIDWDNDHERQAVLEELVADCERALRAAGRVLTRYADDTAEACDIMTATELLRKLLAQDVKRDEAGAAQLIDGVAPDRIVAVHDPEMRHGRKSVSQRFDGYKGAIGVDADSQMITGVDLLTASAPDGHSASPVIQQTEQLTSVFVQTVIGDTAYGTVEARLDAETEGRTLVAPVPQIPRTGRFSKSDFCIDLQHNQVSCPAGHTTTRWFSGTDKTKRGSTFTRKKFTFSKRHCKPCPLRDQCLGPRTGFRTVTVHEHEEILQRARAYQHTEEFRTIYRKRVVAEHRIARLIQLGLRKARYFGSTKVLFQLAIAAAVANLTLVARSFLSLLIRMMSECLCVAISAATAGKVELNGLLLTFSTGWITQPPLPRKTRGLRLSF